MKMVTNVKKKLDFEANVVEVSDQRVSEKSTQEQLLRSYSASIVITIVRLRAHIKESKQTK